MFDNVSGLFFQQGILGIIIIVLGFVIAYQERQKAKLQSDIHDLYTALNTLQEKRVLESGVYLDKFISTANNLIKQNRETLEIGRTNQQAIERIANILQTI